MTSTIKVNKHQNACGTNIIQRCGTTTTIGSGASNTLVMDGSTVTIGRCGGTVALASGATQTGFGRTGTVDWQTGSIKTATFTAANGEGYFCNTSGGAFTMNLPAGSAGAIVSIVDYTNTFQTNSLTISPNGSEKIGGVAANFIASTEGQSLTFVYVDATEGWKNIQDSTTNAVGNAFLVATGGTVTTCGNCKIHTFTGPGTFTVSKISCTAPENTVSYLVVAGGGGAIGAGGHGSAGAGAGGFREVKAPTTPYTASPLDGYPSSPNRITVTATSFPITVGAGGTNTPSNSSGSNSIFSTITSAGGGKANGEPTTGQPGGSAAGGYGAGSKGGGTGNTPPTTPAQGTNGGSGVDAGCFSGSGGGGGATVAGGNGSPNTGGTPGTGATTNITASPVAYASGGAGGSRNGSMGGGVAQNRNGDANTGEGGAGQNAVSGSGCGGTGGSGIVVIRYKYQ